MLFLQKCIKKNDLLLWYFHCNIACWNCNAMCFIVVCEFSINMVVVIKTVANWLIACRWINKQVLYILQYCAHYVSFISLRYLSYIFLPMICRPNGPNLYINSWYYDKNIEQHVIIIWRGSKFHSWSGKLV